MSIFNVNTAGLSDKTVNLLSALIFIVGKCISVTFPTYCILGIYSDNMARFYQHYTCNILTISTLTFFVMY